jgi:hypothetical protein
MLLPRKPRNQLPQAAAIAAMLPLLLPSDPARQCSGQQETVAGAIPRQCARSRATLDTGSMRVQSLQPQRKSKCQCRRPSWVISARGLSQNRQTSR